MSSAVIFQIQSCLILVLLYTGIYFRRRRDVHVKLMSAAIVWDIILILQIELSRSAIVKASRALTNSYWLNIHVTLALLTVIFYVAMIITGRKVLRGNLGIQPLHKKMGLTTATLRTLTFITSFLAVQP